MPTYSAVYASILILEAVLSLSFAMMAWRRRQERGASMFVILMMALSIWSFSYGMEQLFYDLSSKSLWHHMAYLGIPLVGPAWAAFSVKIRHNPGRWLHRLVPLFYLEAAIIIILAWTDSWHAILWSVLKIDRLNGFLYLDIVRAPGFYVHAAISYFFILFGTAFFLNLLIKSRTLHGFQIILLGIGILVPLPVNVLYVLGLNPLKPLDLTPLVLTTAGISAGWFVFRFQLSDLLPLVWETVFGSMRDGVVVLNKNYRILNANPAAQHLLDYTSTEVLNTQIDHLIPNAIGRIQHHAQSPASVTPNTAPWEFSPPGRSDRRLELSISDLIDRRNRHTGWMLVIRDVTRRRMVEDALRESERQYRTLIEFSPDAIIVIDINMIITLLNKRALELSGAQSFGDIAGRSIFDFVAEADHQRLRDSIPATLEAGKAGNSIYTIRRTDGNEGSVELNATVLLDPSGKPKGFLAIVRDVEERLRSEESRRQAQRMEGIGLLAGGVAHDFNNMLTSMIAQNSLALARLDDANPSRTHITKAIKAAERAADLTRQLLAYAGKGNLQVAPLDLNRLIRENDALLETAVPRKTRLSILLSPDLPYISADQGQMQQVIMNLVLNATEAIENEIGDINVRTDMHFLGEDESHMFLGNESLDAGDYVRLRVEDSGVGMSAEMIDRIFDPFFTTKPTGRGLGLSALLGIIRSHHGALRVESTLGDGTVFHVVFPPLKADATELHELPPAAVRQLGFNLSGTVLLVDDEVSVRDSLAEILRVVGLRVLTANDGQQGVDTFLANQDDIDLILLDLSMPVMDGHEALARIREVDSELRVILLSGYSKTEISDAALNSQHTLFVQKPFSPRKLISTVSDILSFA